MRDSGLIAIVPHRLSDNYWKIDFIQHSVTSAVEDLSRTREDIDTLQKLQTDLVFLSADQRNTLLFNLSHYVQKLARLRGALISLDVSLELALDGKDLSIEATQEAFHRRTAAKP
jgi:hypothetical protein